MNGFNYQAAAAVYDTISKLDDDSARMFAAMLAHDLLAHDLVTGDAVLTATLAKHLDAYGDTMRERVVAGYVAKRKVGAPVDAELAAAQTLAKAFEGFDYSPSERARRAHQQQRDLASGRFVAAHHDVNYSTVRGARPLADKQAEALGIVMPPVGRGRPRLDPQQTLRYQTAYQQIGGMLQPYLGRAGPGGNPPVLHLQFADGQEVVTAVPQNRAGLADTLGAVSTRKTPIIGASVSIIPTAESAITSPYDTLRDVGYAGREHFGGAAVPESVGNFTTDLGNARAQQDPAARLFHRIGAGSALYTAATGGQGPPALTLAAQTGRYVGMYGPEAQKVIGPTVDRAAYRYRGTERPPDPRLTNAFDAADRRAGETMPQLTALHRDRVAAKAQRDAVLARHESGLAEDIGAVDDRQRAGELTPEQAAAERARISGHRAGMAAAAKTQYAQFEAAQPSMISLLTQRQARARAYAVHGADHETGWDPGPVNAYFRARLPKPELNALHYTSGVIPPSEGVIIDRKGNLTTQAVGYGDDWYLPFNLRHLSALRGGEYLRTRSWGGPTTEDIYTGLMTGASSLTVVSNNGVYTVEFDRSFKGGRRYNDKAARMVARYGHLLDAIEGTEVRGGDIHPTRIAEIEREAADTYDPDESERSNQLYESEVLRQKRAEVKRPKLSDAQRLEAGQQFLDEVALNQRTPDGREMTREDLQRQHLNARVAAQLRSAPESMDREQLRRQVTAEAGLTDPDSLRGTQRMIESMGLQDQYAGYLKRYEDTYRRSLQPMKLNGPGYEAALNALQEQFPYYIRAVTYHPWDDAARGADTGYVRPGRNRPAMAQAGYAAAGGKVNADETRYQAGITAASPTRAQADRTAAAAARRAGDGGAPTPAGTGTPGTPGTPATGPGAADQLAALSPQTRRTLQRAADQSLFDWLKNPARTVSSSMAPPGTDATDPTNPMALSHGQPLATAALNFSAPGPHQQLQFAELMRLTPDAATALLDSDPEQFHNLLDASLAAVTNYHVVSVPDELRDKFLNRGLPSTPTAFDRTNIDAALSQLGRDSAFGGKYARGRTPAQYAEEYADPDNRTVAAVIEHLDLPATLDDATMPDKIEAARQRLRDTNAAWAAWDVDPRPGTRPAGARSALGPHAEGLKRAAQLHRRWTEATAIAVPAAATGTAGPGPGPGPGPGAPTPIRGGLHSVPTPGP